MQGCIFTLGRALLRKLTTAANRLFGPEMPLSCVDLNVPRKVSLTCRIAHSANQRTVDDRFQNNHHLLLHMTSTSCQSGETGVRKFQNQVSIKIAFSSDGYRQRSKSTEFQFCNLLLSACRFFNNLWAIYADNI